jgi:hypothetical protein
VTCHYYHHDMWRREPCEDYAHCHAVVYDEPDPCHAKLADVKRRLAEKVDNVGWVEETYEQLLKDLGL